MHRTAESSVAVLGECRDIDVPDLVSDGALDNVRLTRQEAPLETYKVGLQPRAGMASTATKCKVTAGSKRLAL